MDHEKSLKNPNEFFKTIVLINLNDKLCLDKEGDMLEWEILKNYAAWILDAKYVQIDTNGTKNNLT